MFTEHKLAEIRAQLVRLENAVATWHTCGCGLVYAAKLRNQEWPAEWAPEYVDDGACRFCLPAKQQREKAVVWAKENPAAAMLCKNRHDAQFVSEVEKITVAKPRRKRRKT